MRALARLTVSILVLNTCPWCLGLSAQETGAPSGTTAPKAAASDEPGADKADKPVIVKRQAMQLVPRNYYRVPLQLRAAKMVQLTSPVDGTIREVRHVPGDKVEAQAELIRLNSVEQELLVERAKANYRASQIEVKRAQSSGGDKDLLELAEARSAAAKAELDLASYRLEQASIRAPFNSVMFRVNVMPGQFVRAGEVLATVGDTSVMVAELPVDRKTAAAGKALKFQVESEDVEGKIQSVLPPEAGFERLREIVDSVATGVLLIENTGGKLQVGQTVYSPLVPRDPISEIPNSAISNLSDGARKVQVVRGNIIRDVRVDVLGGVGPTRSFVSGPFEDRDEVVVSISRELPDGTLLRPHANATSATGEGAATAVPPRNTLPGSKPNDPLPKKSGF